MERVVLGFVAGAIAASIVLFAVRYMGPQANRRQVRLWIEFAILVALIAILIAGLMTPSSTVTWVQYLLGGIAGFVFRGWFAFAVREILMRQEHMPTVEGEPGPAPAPPPEPMGEAPAAPADPGTPSAAASAHAEEDTGSSWWASEPWRGLALIAILVAGALALPKLDVLIRQYNFNKVHFGILELEVTRGTAVLHGLTREQNRQRVGIQVLSDLVDSETAAKRMESDARFLAFATKGLPLAQKTIDDETSGNAAYSGLYNAILSPVARCIDTVAANSPELDQVSANVAAFAQRYGALVEAVQTDAGRFRARPEKERATARARIEGAAERLRSIGRELLADNGKLSAAPGACDATQLDALKPAAGSEKASPALSADRLADLALSSRTHLALADLYFIAGARLLAIETLSRVRRAFSYNMNIDYHLAQFWHAEGHSSAMAMEAARRFLLMAEDFKRFAASSDTATDADKVRAERALALARNSWAYQAATADERLDEGVLGEVTRAARAAATDHFDLVADKDAAKRDSLRVMEELVFDNGSLAWSAVDTYAAVLMAGMSDDDVKDKGACVVEMFRLAKDWYAKRLRAAVNKCVQTGDCREMRKHYRSARYSYDVISGHYRIAKETFEKRGVAGDCDADAGYRLLPMLWPRPYRFQ